MQAGSIELDVATIAVTDGTQGWISAQQERFTNYDGFVTLFGNAPEGREGGCGAERRCIVLR
jgi:hypothetical protein